MMKDTLLHTGIPGFSIRPAVEADCALILRFIRALANYERLEHEVTATEEGLRQSLFVDPHAEVILGEKEGRPVAFALFFHNYSTFLGKANLYLEDLFVEPVCRGKGYGKAMLACLARIARSRGCQRLDWWCLNWNESAIAFYKRLGAVPMDEWAVYRLEGKALAQLAAD